MRLGRERNVITGAVAARPWRTVSWAVIDFETTGLDLDLDDIVSIGIVPVINGLIDRSSCYYSLVRPTSAISEDAMKVHSLTADELRDAPTPAEVADELARRFGDALLVAHAAWIERAFLERLSDTSGHELPLPLVDTAALSRAAHLVESVGSAHGYEPALEDLARRLDLPVFTPHHALGDAMTTAVLFLALASRVEQTTGTGGELTVGQLNRLSRRHRR